jgi:hypothetical protein
MRDTLIQKLQTSIEQDIWNYDDSIDPNRLVSPLKDAVIEWNDTGYFEIKKDKIMFNDCVNGHTFTLKKNGTREDWKKFQDLFIEASETKLFRIDAPIFREELLIAEIPWEYTKVARPGGGVGQIADQHYMNTNLLVDFMNSIIDPFYYIIKSAIDVVNNNPRLTDPATGFHPPITIPQLSIRHALKDDQGYYFVKNFDQWDQNPEKVIRTCITLGQIMIKDLGTTVPPEFLNDWTVRSFNKWTSLL